MGKRKTRKPRARRMSFSIDGIEYAIDSARIVDSHHVVVVARIADAESLVACVLHDGVEDCFLRFGKTTLVARHVTLSLKIEKGAVTLAAQAPGRWMQV